MAKGKMGYKIRTITCVVCNKVVTDHMREGQKYCSLECYRNSPRPQRKTGKDMPCKVCGTLTYFSASEIKKNKSFFCSVEHANEWQARNKVSYTCKTCGGEFKWSPSRTTQANPTYCTLACRDADPDQRARLIQMNIDQARGKTTKLEITGYRLLDKIGVEYERQALLFDRFCVDAFYPDINIVVQFDGDYWHGHPEKFPAPDERQRKRMWTDRGQDAFMKKRGYNVIRVWESDIKSNQDLVYRRLFDAINYATDRKRSGGSLSLSAT